MIQKGDPSEYLLQKNMSVIKMSEGGGNYKEWKKKNAVAIGPVTGPLVPWLLVRQLVTWSSTNQIHAIFMRSTMRFVPYLHSSRIAVSSVQSDIFSPVGSILAA